MLGLKIMFYFVAFILILCFMVNLMQSTIKDRSVQQRNVDLFISLIILGMLLILTRFYIGGVLQ